MTSRSFSSALAVALNPPPVDVFGARWATFRRRSSRSSTPPPNSRCSSAAAPGEWPDGAAKTGSIVDATLGNVPAQCPDLEAKR
jgi:hypothetical protein